MDHRTLVAQRDEGVELTGQVRDWLDRAAERVMDRLEPASFAGLGQSDLALAGELFKVFWVRAIVPCSQKE